MRVSNSQHLKAVFVSIFVCSFGMVSLQAQQPSLSGVVYTDFTFDTYDNSNAFNIERVYITLRGDVNPDIQYRITSDVMTPEEAGAGYQLILKYAYLAWNNEDFGTVTAGMSGTNAFKVQENTWGYRYLFKSAMDQFGYASSAGIGISYDRELLDDVSLSAQVMNGGGYKSSETNRGKRLHLRVLYGPDDLSENSGLNAGLYGSWEKMQSESDRFVYSLFSGYGADNYRFGGEIAAMVSNNQDIIKTKDYLVSAYGQAQLSRVLEVFGRVDYSGHSVSIESSSDPLIDENIMWTITGVEYTGFDNLKIAPNVLYWYHSDVDNHVILRVNLEFVW